MRRKIGEVMKIFEKLEHPKTWGGTFWSEKNQIKYLDNQGLIFLDQNVTPWVLRCSSFSNTFIISPIFLLTLYQFYWNISHGHGNTKLIIWQHSHSVSKVSESLFTVASSISLTLCLTLSFSIFTELRGSQNCIPVVLEYTSSSHLSK